MRKKNYIKLFVVSCFMNTAMAGTMGAMDPMFTRHWFAALSGGPVWAKAGKTQTFYLAPEMEKSYVANKGANTLPAGELSTGVQMSFSPYLLAQLGVAVAATGNAKLQGIIWDDAQPQFANYTYQYKVDHAALSVKGKLLVDKGYWLMPWLSGSIGIGFNRAHSFTNTPIIFEAVNNSNFTAHTKTAFTYTVGAGVQKLLNQHWQMGVGYEFSDWGSNQLVRASGQTMNQGLTLSHLYTNGVLFNLTYIA